MGMDLPALQHLIHCKKYGSFGKTLTVGRQQIILSPNEISGYLQCNKNYSGYCEELLIDNFEASTVDSIDNSSYEGSTIIHDLNKIIDDKNHIGKYDTIIDLGTLEHIYHINNAFYNLSKLCKNNGQIIHVLPSNQFCGHGFWQMSPELFFSLYSKNNGYSDTEIFVFDTRDIRKVEKLEPPSNGKRILIDSVSPIYVAVRTVLTNKSFSHDEVQQSDYVYLWDRSVK